MSEFSGSFLGFSYDGIHSSELGLVRVSNGSRYTDNFLPTAQDKTVQVPGSDGTYYYGTLYTQKPFTLQVAYDSISEKQFRRIRQLFGAKGLHTLVFDEYPYKQYTVKSTGSPNLQFVCFDGVDSDVDAYTRKADLYGTVDGDFYEGSIMVSSYDRVYKGEGTLNFVSYYPYAKSRYSEKLKRGLKYFDDFSRLNIPDWDDYTWYKKEYFPNNFLEWDKSLSLIKSDYSTIIGTTTYTIDKVNDKGVLVYNPGDLETPFIFRIKAKYENNVPVSSTIPSLILDLGEIFGSLSIESFALKTGDSGVQINSKTHLIEGIDANNNLTGTIYNEYITGGDFFKITVTDEPVVITIDGLLSSFDNFDFEIVYDYLYY